MFDWLFKRGNFIAFEDSFARTRSSMFAELDRSIRRLQKQENQRTLLVCHFPETFFGIQDFLRECLLEYSIVDHPRESREMSYWFGEKTTLAMTLAEMVLPNQVAAVESNTSFNVMVLERHPLATPDDKLMNALKSSGSSISCGYFLSFEDELVKFAIDDSAVKILDMFGMGQNELINSNLISRRLMTIQRRFRRQIENELSANSMREWLSLNLPT